MPVNPNPAQANAEAVAKAKADALNDPNSANSILAAVYDDHDWRPAVLDTNTTEGIKNTLKAHASAIQALANHIDGIHKARSQPAAYPQASAYPTGSSTGGATGTNKFNPAPGL